MSNKYFELVPVSQKPEKDGWYDCIATTATFNEKQLRRLYFREGNFHVTETSKQPFLTVIEWHRPLFQTASDEKEAEKYAGRTLKSHAPDHDRQHCIKDFLAGILHERACGKGWVSVKDKPLIISFDDHWEQAEGAPSEFIAAVEVHNTKTGEDYWWIRHCVIEDNIGLCVVGDDDNQPAGWEIPDVQFYHPLPPPPKP
jgi:hypothetical protein